MSQKTSEDDEGTLDLTPENKSLSFKAGRLKLFISEWAKLTSDDSILDIVIHCHLEFENGCVPSQTSLPHQIKFNNKECLYISKMK